MLLLLYIIKSEDSTNGNVFHYRRFTIKVLDFSRFSPYSFLIYIKGPYKVFFFFTEKQSIWLKICYVGRFHV